MQPQDNQQNSQETNSLTGTPTNSSGVNQTPILKSARTKQPKAKKQVSLVFAILLSILVSALFSLGAFFGALAMLDHKNTPEQSREIITSEGEIFNKIASDVGQSVVSILTIEGTQTTSAGTGFIINDQGLILTNKHVLQEASGGTVKVVDDKNQEYVATIVGRDPANDLAFLEVKNLPSTVPPVKLADSSKVKVGDKVLAIGNALGEFQNSVTSGIVSGIGRPIEINDEESGSYESLSNLIQTDAAINPGNSGGPLVNIAGEVIGINTAIVEGAEGIGFSIPINDAKALIAQVEAGETLAAKAYLGVRYVALTDSIADQLNLSINQGALIYASGRQPIQPGSPAEAAGLRQYDVITKVGEVPINAVTPLSGALNKFKAGDQVQLTVYRNNQSIIVPITLTAAPN